MSDFLKKLYKDYIKPQIDAHPRGEYSAALSAVENEIPSHARPDYDKAAEFIAIRAFLLGLTVGRGLAESVSG